MQSTKTKIESYPTPTQLTTKTDLSPQEVKYLSNREMLKILANISFLQFLIMFHSKRNP
ncbi:MAG: hypothetical protein WA364_13740 [Candidatus Nitrosopolaris sp.]